MIYFFYDVISIQEPKKKIPTNSLNVMSSVHIIELFLFLAFVEEIAECECILDLCRNAMSQKAKKYLNILSRGIAGRYQH